MTFIAEARNWIRGHRADAGAEHEHARPSPIPGSRFSLPLPLARAPSARPCGRARRACGVPFFDRLVDLTGQERTAAAPSRCGDDSLLALRASAVCLDPCDRALMRPQWIEPPLHRDLPTRDLLLLVDLSGSMDTKDFVDASGKTVDRLAAVKEVLGDFLERRKGDRVGVVVFGDAPFALVPVHDRSRSSSRTLLGETAVGMAGPRTAFGDAIGLGISLFDKSTVKAKTIIALTDGNDTASKVPPAEAAGVAKDKGIVIHTVAVGDPAAAARTSSTSRR